MYLKNTASQKLEVFAFDYTTGAPKTGDGANLLAYVNIDEAGYGTLTDTSATEVDSTNKKGLYLFDLTQGETNGTKLGFFAKSSTANVSCICRPAVSFTQPTTGILAPTTAGRTLDVSSTGEAGLDWANVGSPTTTLALTGTTIADTQKCDVNTIKTQTVTCAAGVTVNVNVGTTQPVNFTGTAGSALVKTDVIDIAGTASAGVAGYMAPDWSHVNAPTTTVALTGTTIASTQKVDIETIKTNPVVNGGTITFPTGATLASTTNITAGTITTVSGNVAGSVGSVTGLTTATIATAVLTTQMTESYAADGAAPTLAQNSFLVQQALTEFSIASTTMTIKKIDGSATAATCTLDSATAPTSITRAT